MIKVGDFNKLKAVRQTDNGVYLTDKEGTQEVLLPNKFMPEELYEDDILNVFVFKDHGGRLTATTRPPKATVNSFAYLLCKDVNKYGAFLDWGLEKDLMVPFREQLDERMKEGQSYLVYIYEDEVSGRLVGTARYLRYLQNHKHINLKEGEEVDLIVDNTSDLGTNVIINNQYQGLIHQGEFFTKLKKGDKVKGYVKLIRNDKRIDVTLHPDTFDKVASAAKKILDMLKKNEGSLPYHDNSPAPLIRKELEMSKKVFKQAIGGLYSRRLIVIKENGIFLTS